MTLPFVYEYINVTLRRDQSKNGTTLKKLQSDDVVSKEDFNSLWKNLSNVFNTLEGLNDDDRSTIELIY